MHCEGLCIKAGLQKNGSQRLRCKSCHRYQLQQYKSQAWKPEVVELIKTLLVEGVGIRGTARVLKISVTTVIKRIKKFAACIDKPFINLCGRVIELDEMWTYMRNKSTELWITYAIDRKSKEVIDFIVGSRRSEEIGKVVIPLIVQKVKKI